MTRKPYQLTLDEYWRELPQPKIYPDEYMINCKLHGSWCPNAYWSPKLQASMLAKQGFIDCPFCMMEIVGP